MTEDSTNPEKRPNGTPPGQATMPGGRGGRIGNPAHEPTEASRQRVRDLAKVFPLQGMHHVAKLIGVSVPTLYKYYRDEIEIGRAELGATLGTQMINRAIEADKAKGDLDAQKFILARLFGWSTKVDVTQVPADLESAVSEYDLSELDDDELEELHRLALKANGMSDDAGDNA